MKNQPENKKIITTGIIRWWRFLIGFVVFMITLDMVQNNSYSLWKTSIILCLSGVTYWLWKRRKLRFDSKNLYIKRGNIETTVALTNVISIKRSKAKVNGSRFWVLVYLNNLKEKKTLRFDSDFNKDFFETVKKNNPKVIILTHPFFNH